MNENQSRLYFSGIDFANFISFVKSTFQTKSTNAKIAILHVEGEDLVCRAIDDMLNYIEYKVHLFALTNLIEEPVGVYIDDMAVLIKAASGSNFTIRKQSGQYEFSVVGDGWQPFKTAEVNLESIIPSGDISNLGEVNSLKLKNVINMVLNYTMDSVYSQDKYIRFSDTKMYATSRLSGVLAQGEFLNMVVHRNTLNMLKFLIRSEYALLVKTLNSDVDRLIFEGDCFKLVVIQSDVSAEQTDVLDIKDFIAVNYSELSKLVALSQEYSASKHSTGLQVKNGMLEVTVNNILYQRHGSIIQSFVVGNLKDTTARVDISSNNLMKALKLFQDKKPKNINIYISDDLSDKQDCIVLFDDSTQAFVNISSR